MSAIEREFARLYPELRIFDEKEETQKLRGERPGQGFAAQHNGGSCMLTPQYQFSQWYDYDIESLIEFAPVSSGLYAIVRIQDDLPILWIYVGKHEQSIFARLLRHHSGKSDNAACIDSYNPTHFAFVSIPKGASLNGCEIATIQKYQPTCNDQHTLAPPQQSSQ